MIPKNIARPPSRGIGMPVDAPLVGDVDARRGGGPCPATAGVSRMVITRAVRQPQTTSEVVRELGPHGRLTVTPPGVGGVSRSEPSWCVRDTVLGSCLYFVP